MADNVFGEVRGPRLRVRLPAGGNSGQAITVTADAQIPFDTPNVIPAKEWSLVDDVLNVSDPAAFTVANDDGENSGKFYIGQRIEIDESDPDVQQGKWLRQLTGRVTALGAYSDANGGSNILVSAMDLGWHLSACHAPPLLNIKRIKLGRLVDGYTNSKGKRVPGLIDPTWGFAPTEFSGTENTRLKHGRQVIIQDHKPVLGSILPFIQVEPGQAPFEILRLYAQREGLLINVGAKGQLILFRPDYKADPLYSVEFHGSRDGRRTRNNIIGRPALNETIDGRYSRTECWSTVVIPPEIVNSEDPNEIYRHSSYEPSVNPLPFRRLHVFSDGEAINDKLRKNRAIWKQQMGEFESWQYEVEFPSHSQSGSLLVSNTIISVNDSVHLVSGSYFVQAVRRSERIGEGTRARLTVRKVNLLNPELAGLTTSKKKAVP